MPSTKWNVVLRNPITALKILLLASTRSTIILLLRIIFPFRVRKLTLRNALAREWIATAQESNPNIFLSEPWRHSTQSVTLVSQTENGQKESRLGGWVIPDTNVSELKDKDVVVLFAHGGGYALGHGLHNLSMFKRLVGKAKKMGQNLAFVSVNYRKWSFYSCRESFAANRCFT
jgi:hypothetical protein